MADAPPLSVTAVTTAASLDALRPQWQALWRADPHATPFASPAWLLPWWRHIGQGELLTLTVHSGNALVGLLPLYVYTQPVGGSRDVFPIGIATTDYLDPLFAPGHEAAAAAAALAFLNDCDTRWDVLDLQQLRPDSPMLRVPCPAGWHDAATDGEACPVLDLPASVGELPSRLPPRMAHNLRYARNRAARQGAVRIDRANANDWEALFDAHLRLHRARWQGRDQEGVMADTAVQAAHREALPHMLADGTLRLYALRLDDRIIATLCGFLGGNGPHRRFYYYLGGFDPAFDKISPGTLLIGHAMERAVEDGATTFDFLRGGEAYKYAWGANDTPTRRRRFWRKAKGA